MENQVKTLTNELVFTKYHYPNFGEIITLETLRRKLEEVEEVYEEHEEGGSGQITYYGW